MQEQYIREQNIIDKTEEQKRVELIKSIISAREELKNVRNNFEYAEHEMIDYYTYQIKASEEKLDYLIKKAKLKGIVLDRINELRIRIDRENEAV